MTKIMHVQVAKVQTEGLQARAGVNEETVREYAEAATTGGVTLPPILVYRDERKCLWVGDGIHRLAAAKRIGQRTIAADVRDGTRTDALRYALGANGTHGLRRTSADKAHAVKMAYERRTELGLPDVPSARAIAEIVGVSPTFAGDQLSTVDSWKVATARTGADGKRRDLPPVPTRRPLTAVPRSALPERNQANPPAPAPLPPTPSTVPLSSPPTRPAASEPAADAAATDEDAAAEGPVDARGRHIPHDLLPIWNRRHEVRDLAMVISRVRIALEKVSEGHDPLWAELQYQSVKTHLDQAFYIVSSAQPWCVCPMCQGIGCRACRESGLMGKYRFDNIVPRELKLAPCG
jgi:uncharacterized ParB-like nuclease family protein